MKLNNGLFKIDPKEYTITTIKSQFKTPKLKEGEREQR